MEQSKPTATTPADLVNQVPFGASMTPVLAPQARAFWEAQERILGEAEAFSKHWFERRHQAATTALEAAKTATQNGTTDPGALMKTIADWQAHSVQRMAEDFQEWVALCSRCATHVATHEAQSIQDVMEKTAGSALKSSLESSPDSSPKSKQ